MTDSVGVQREAREVIEQAIRESWDEGGALLALHEADRVLAALADVGFSVVKLGRHPIWSRNDYVVVEGEVVEHEIASSGEPVNG